MIAPAVFSRENLPKNLKFFRFWRNFGVIFLCESREKDLRNGCFEAFLRLSQRFIICNALIISAKKIFQKNFHESVDRNENRRIFALAITNGRGAG